MEIIFNVEKPFTDEEIRDFKSFRLEVKSLIKTGKLKVAEKFQTFSFTVVDYTSAEKNSIKSLLQNENLKVKIIR